jgi:hypothetical protein
VLVAGSVAKRPDVSRVDREPYYWMTPTFSAKEKHRHIKTKGGKK